MVEQRDQTRVVYKRVDATSCLGADRNDPLKIAKMMMQKRGKLLEDVLQ